MGAMIFPIFVIIFFALLLAWFGPSEYTYYCADIVFSHSNHEFEGITVSCLSKKQRRRKKNLRQHAKTHKWEIAVESVSLWEPRKIVWRGIRKKMAEDILHKEKLKEQIYITILNEELLLAQ